MSICFRSLKKWEQNRKIGTSLLLEIETLFILAFAELLAEMLKSCLKKIKYKILFSLSEETKNPFQMFQAMLLLTIQSVYITILLNFFSFRIFSNSSLVSGWSRR